MSQAGTPDPAPPSLSFALADDGVATLTLLGAHPRAGRLSLDLLHELDRHLDAVHAEVAAGRCRALVLASDRADVWVAGTDLDEVRALATAEQATAYAQRGQGVLRRLEMLPVPSFAAIRGTCRGSGLELALACGHRIADDADATRLGFPETPMGLVPVLGGTVRLPRLVGLQAATELLLSSRELEVQAALRLGLVDGVLPADAFGARLRELVLERVRSGRPRGAARRGLATRLAEETAPGRRLILERARRRLARVRGGQYGPARRTLELLVEGMAQPLDAAFDAAARAFGEMVVSEESRGLLHSYRLVHGARAGAGAEAAAVDQVAVVGGGIPAAQVAHLCAFHGLPVRLKSQRREQSARAREYVGSLFRDQAERGILEPAAAAERLQLIRPGLGFGGFGTADVVLVELPRGAEPEPAALLAEVEEHVRDGCPLVLAPVPAGLGALQPRLREPERLVGLHLFPLPRVRLVEIVRGPATSDAAVAAVHRLAVRLAKSPIVVAEHAGYVLHRLVAAYVGEALRLLDAGATVQQVDTTMRAFAMGIGPLRLLDEVGLDWYAGVARRLEAAWGERLAGGATLAALIEAGHTGRRGRRGFYRYSREGKEAGTNPDVYTTLHTRREAPPAELPSEVVQRRILLMMINEAAHILGDGAAAAAADVDLATLHGLGFPARRGGLLWYADRLGPRGVADELRRLAEADARYAPAPLLAALAERGGQFYDAPAESGQAAGEVLQ